MTTTYPLPAIVVDPGGGSTAVSITTPSGTTPTVYQDRFGVTPWTMPTVIGSATLFYLPDPGSFVVNGVATVNVETTQVATVNLGEAPGQWMSSNFASNFVVVVEVSQAYSSAKNTTLINNALFKIAANGGGHLVIVCHGTATTNGGHVVPSGTWVTMHAGGWRPSVSVTENALQADPGGPWTTTPWMFAGNEWANNTLLADVGIDFDHLIIDMNGVSAHGLVAAARNCTFRNNNVWNWAGAFSGLVCGSNTNTTATLNNNKLYKNIVQIASPVAGGVAGQHAIWITNLGSGCTDTDIESNLLNGCGDNIIHCDSGGNVNVFGKNHGSTLTKDGASFIYYTLLSSAEIVGNIMDDTSRPGASGQTNSVIHVAAVAPTFTDASTAYLSNRQNLIWGNRLHADEQRSTGGGTAGAATWNYIQIDSVQTQHTHKIGYVQLGGQMINQDRAGTGTSSAYSFTAGTGQTLNVRLETGQVQGASATPVIGAGTVTVVTATYA